MSEQFGPPAPPRSARRTTYISAVIRGGVLRRANDWDPVLNVYREAAYDIRLDQSPHGLAPLTMATWLRLELDEDERRQWAAVLLDGLP